MSAAKKGFLIYFDNYPMVCSLPAEQRGHLFTALMVYADRVWRDPSVTLEEVSECFSKLSPEARVALGFMGAAVRRDTEAWLSKQDYRVKRKQEQQVSSAASDRRAREDMERTRRLMEQLREPQEATPAPRPVSS